MKLSYRRHTFNVPLCFLRLLKRRMRYVRAAGGVVEASDGSLLAIVRNGRYDLPKGKVELGETLLQAALREVEEETGLKVLPATRNPQPTKTYHIYNLYGGWHLKQTSWFAMRADGKPEVVPQLEEGITGGCWFSPDEWHSAMLHSYGTMRTVAANVTR
ncbi:MAG: NUDIX domain-containing protein [Bacteroidales bacterium]|nr:NUDIX domain-containing protein [Bacteroidales bacterium]